jgi:hypothetical protein
MIKVQPLDASTLRTALRFHLDHGETLESIGDAFGVTLWSVWGWVHGKRNPSRQTLTQAAYLLAQASDAEPGLPSISGNQQAIRKVFRPSVAQDALNAPKCHAVNVMRRAG